ncbi:hypothetical protein [Pseudorhodobacter antarcticus]|uniref:hypothetical protein n=1 Tax=Pseudorhodobacter antarcticus TaxID=1077947 RepID=UPI00067DA060|nr:hypothetical protein [Pseudorhodobacter antarcticus]
MDRSEDGAHHWASDGDLGELEGVGAGGGAPTDPGNGAWVHGDRSQAVETGRRNLMALVKLARDCANELHQARASD